MGDQWHVVADGDSSPCRGRARALGPFRHVDLVEREADCEEFDFVVGMRFQTGNQLSHARLERFRLFLDLLFEICELCC